jgi:hypothetical protein
MKGSPLLQLLGLALVLGALAFPLRYLTSAPHKEVRTVEPIAPNSESKSVELKLVSPTVPYTFEIEFLGKPLWTGTARQTTETTTVQIPFPAEGVDLTVDAHWTNPAMVALQLTLTLPDQAPLAQTLWGDGKVSDTITFKENTR